MGSSTAKQSLPNPLAEASPAFLDEYRKSIKATAPDLPPSEAPKFPEVVHETPALAGAESSSIVNQTRAAADPDGCQLVARLTTALNT
ncbi:MAG TPA: hypothetical protein VK473_17345 [Terriglobales bacterium]|nr:hypothetical protein [Terriglobales bacterium]